MEKFAERMKELRKENNLTFEELADRVGDITKTSLSRYESGAREPKLPLLKKLADIFGCSIDYLAGESDYRNAEELIKMHYEEGYDIDEVFHLLNTLSNNNLTKEHISDIYQLLEVVRKLNQTNK